MAVDSRSFKLVDDDGMVLGLMAGFTLGSC